MELARRKTVAAIAMVAFSLAISVPAGAQLLGAQGDAVFGAERLFGIRGERVYEDNPNPQPDLEDNHTVISIGLTRTEVPYNIPRLTFDYLVVDKVSVGGALGYMTRDQRREGIGSQTSNLFVLAPRTGFLHMFGRVGGIWPRGGLTYHRAAAEDAFVESGLGVNLECYFPFVFTPHFGMLVGLAFDQTLTANRDPENGVDYPVSYRSVGLQLGLFGWI